jgi:hypothetical protein
MHLWSKEFDRPRRGDPQVYGTLGISTSISNRANRVEAAKMHSAISMANLQHEYGYLASVFRLLAHCEPRRIFSFQSIAAVGDVHVLAR